MKSLGKGEKILSCWEYDIGHNSVKKQKTRILTWSDGHAYTSMSSHSVPIFAPVFLRLLMAVWTWSYLF